MRIPLFLRPLDRYRWFRVLLGGHWEYWHVEYCGKVWHDVPECTHDVKTRPTPICRGTPVCEHWDGTLAERIRLLRPSLRAWQVLLTVAFLITWRMI